MLLRLLHSDADDDGQLDVGYDGRLDVEDYVR